MAKKNRNKQPVGSLGNGYRITGEVDPATGAFVVLDAAGNRVKGAVPYVNGQGRGVRLPVDELADLPAGSYDPGLLYQSQNANLGQLYNTQDFQTAWRGFDPDTQPADLSNAGTAVQDYWSQRSALAEALARARQDYTTSTETLGRNYRILGNNQLQSINQRGLLSGGALAQALAKRTENQGREQGQLDLSWSRYGQDNARATTDLTTTTRRAYAEGNTTLGRSQESNALYQGGLFNSAVAQANQSGALVDNPSYQTHNGVLYQVMPNGSRRPVSTSQKKKKKKRPTDTSLHPGPDYGGFDPSVPPPTYPWDS